MCTGLQLAAFCQCPFLSFAFPVTSMDQHELTRLGRVKREESTEIYLLVKAAGRQTWEGIRGAVP